MTKRTNPTINALSTIVILVIALLIILSKLIPAMVKNTVKKIIVVGFILTLGLTIFTGVKSSKNTLRIFNSGEYEWAITIKQSPSFRPEAVRRA